MTSVQWDMSEHSIVNKTNEPRTQTTFEASPFQKPKMNDPMRFTLQVVAEPMDEGPLLKKANVSTNLPSWGNWDIICDEGTSVGGFDSAPPPLAYFSVGIAFCLLTHIQLSAKVMNVRLDSVRLEQRTTFSTTNNLTGHAHPKDIFGAGEQQETHVIIESSAPADELHDFVKWCEQACMAGQALANTTPSTTQLYLNGDRIGS